MTRVAVVGHEAAKFTPDTEREARALIRRLLTVRDDVVVVSGGCHLGGVDIWAEDEARALGFSEDRIRVYPPKSRTWSYGYKPRNLQIAGDCDEAHAIVVAELPADYSGGLAFPRCYHCGGLRLDHVKSGACWTVMRAQERGAVGFWHIIGPGPTRKA